MEASQLGGNLSFPPLNDSGFFVILVGHPTGGTIVPFYNVKQMSQVPRAVRLLPAFKPFD